MKKSVKIIFSCFLLLFVVVTIVNNIFTYNPSKSEPIGEYMAIPLIPFNKGDLVLTCISNNNYKRVFSQLGMKDVAGACINGLPYLIKRIVAVQGDTIEVSESGILINNVLALNSKQLPTGRGIKLYPIPLGYKYKLIKDEYFMLGQDLNSLDSRYFGIVKKQDIYRRAFLVYRAGV